MILLRCDKIDHSKIQKIKDVNNEDEWIVAVYSQFGFNSMAEIQAFSEKHKEPLYEICYWSKETQEEFRKSLISKLPKTQKKLAERIFDWLNLAWMPRNILKEGEL